MHIAGINWVAVLAAAAAFFVIGYVIHMKLVDLKAWNAAKHISGLELDKLGMSRMAFGLVLPLVTALGLAVLFNWGNVASVSDGVKWALVVAMASAVPALWYNWFYGTAPIWTFLVDSAHQLVGHAVMGAILAGWR
jgi:hypothetical protein